MSKNIIALSIMGAFSVFSFQAGATDSVKYPAYDFKPQVVYKDLGLVATTGSQSDSRFPASHFEPKVLFQDKELIDKLGNRKGTSCQP